ncbi:hypothetical protein FPY71_09735 [Aureimonas fodinaquatilis]|uniref:Lipoprotein n=1 Tax=Aureimonas fodinaquatilis TaxID=2565783 RepID=A0A5B0DYY2_9HYPH|nr:hypothetical protein [Aureimonas fodinaquatilis]KAA0970750.1 hypothetical protein FPY71_09735 [Aureimonas fodinaquatilis]
MPDAMRNRFCQISLALALMLSGCASTSEPELALTPAEHNYVMQTGRSLFRGKPIERARGFLFTGGSGYAVCVRAPATGSQPADYALLVLQRRVTDDYIPQAADDVVILRSATETLPCRKLGERPGNWTTL